MTHTVRRTQSHWRTTGVFSPAVPGMGLPVNWLELLSHRHGLKERRGLADGFLVFAGRHGVSHDARSCLNMDLPILQQRSAQHNTGVHIAVVAKIAERPR